MTKIAADPFDDEDSETGKDYTRKFMGTDEPGEELEKGTKVTASWKGLTGKQQEIPDGEIEDIKYSDSGHEVEYVIRWNNGNNLISLPADYVKSEEPKEKRSGDKKEETIIINGKKYHPIKEKNNG